MLMAGNAQKDLVALFSLWSLRSRIGMKVLKLNMKKKKIKK